jgi:uncharacterized protein
VRIFGAIVLSLLVVPFLRAQTQSQQAQGASPAPAGQTQYSIAPATPPTPVAIDPAKEADIRRLLEVVGTKSLMSEIMTNMEKNLKPTLTASLPPGDYRAKLIDLFLEKFGPRSQALIPKMLDLAIVTYDRYLTDEDIKGLIAFYQTPTGQKTLSVLPKIVVELQTQGQKLGEQAGRETMMEVLSEHPEIVKAMSQPRTGAAPAPAK